MRESPLPRLKSDRENPLLHALAISTCVPAGSDPRLRLRLPYALRTLSATGYPGTVVVVDDGSTDAEQFRFLEGLSARRIVVVRRAARGGVSRTKNTGLRVLAELGVDVGFLADDDIEFRAGWWERYLSAHESTGIAHFSWAWDNDPSGAMRKKIRAVRGGRIVQTSRVNGVLLTFTKEVLSRVGGFRILPHPWGHTNTNWTRRIIAAGLAPYFADVIDSNDVIGINPHGAYSTISDQEKQRWAAENERVARAVEPLLEPLVE